MLNKFYLLLLAIIFLIVSSFKKTETNFTVSIKIQSVLSFTKFDTYTITGNPKSIEITWLKCDSIYFKKTTEDPAYPPILKKITDYPAGFPDQQHIFEIADSLYAIHSLHSIKKIEIKAKDNPAYFNLLDSIIHADSATLTPKDKRHFLDGVDYSVKVRNGNLLNRFAIRYPTPQSHPLLYRFLNATEGFFGNKVAN